MSIDERYETLFRTLQQIAEAEPRRVPQLLAVILAGGPFRPFLDRPELMSKAVVMAKQYVAERKRGTPSATGAARAPAAGAPLGRVVSVRDVAPARPSSKA
jgi:hypothetical protein